MSNSQTMKRNHLEENHRDMPEEVLQKLYENTDTLELQKILKKFRQCKKPDAYTQTCAKVVELELQKRELK